MPQVTLGAIPPIAGSLGPMTSISRHELEQAVFAEAARRVSPTVSAPSRYSSNIEDEYARKMWIAMRLRVSEGHKWPFDCIETHYTGDKVLLFVVVNGNPAILEDEAGLFPSDALITQLRLIQK